MFLAESIWGVEWKSVDNGSDIGGSQETGSPHSRECEGLLLQPPTSASILSPSKHKNWSYPSKFVKRRNHISGDETGPSQTMVNIQILFDLLPLSWQISQTIPHIAPRQSPTRWNFSGALNSEQPPNTPGVVCLWIRNVSFSRIWNVLSEKSQDGLLLNYSKTVIVFV